MENKQASKQKYSPIDKIYIKNFRNIGEATLSFEDSPIICLVGDNEAGKTSAIKAFGVCALHASPREQKSYIRQGTQMFGVAIDLKDGTRITRIKTDDINKYSVQYPDGKVWDTNKISEGLPVQVSELMGLIQEEETKEFLHIRTYEDRLLFVVTPASTNYKVMYDALKVDQLTRAIKLGNAEANSLKQGITNREVSIETMRESLKEITLYDLEHLSAVKDRLKEYIELLNKIEKIKKIKDNIDNMKEELGVLRLINTFGLEPISETTVSKLANVNRLVKTRNELIKSGKILDKIKTLEPIDTALPKKLEAVIDKSNGLREDLGRAGKLIEIDNLEEINITVFNELAKVVRSKEKVEHYKELVMVYDTTSCKPITSEQIEVVNKLNKIIAYKEQMGKDKRNYKAIMDYIKQVDDYLKKLGVAFETCSNCGEDVIIDLDKLDKVGHVH